MNRARKKVNIRDVAKAAGVSIATISKAINNSPEIPAVRRSEIIKVCESLGYTVNTSIQDMVRERRSGSTRNIAFILVNRKFSDSSYSVMLDGMAKSADEYGLHLILEALSGRERSRYDLPPMLRDCRLDGMILAGDLNPEFISVIKATETPYVVIGTYGSSVTEGATNITLDLREGVSLLVGALRRRGSRKIAYFAESLETVYQKDALTLYKAALMENGMPVDDSIIYVGNGPCSGAGEVMKPVFDSKKIPFDGIICLDSRPSHEIETLCMAHFGFGRKPDVIIGYIRTAAAYKFMVPTISCECLMDKLASEAVKALMDNIRDKSGNTGKKIAISYTVNELLES